MLAAQLRASKNTCLTVQSPPADHRAGDREEGLVNLIVPVVTDPQALELVRRGQRLLDEPAEDAQPAAVRRVAPGDLAGDRLARQRHAVAVRVVRPVAHDHARLAERRAPGRPRTAGIASTSGSSCVTSWRLAPVSLAASGTPLASVAKWCLEPFFLRSTGLGPVFSPRASHGRSRSRR
jgi:hypothetical protein